MAGAQLLLVLLGCLVATKPLQATDLPLRAIGKILDTSDLLRSVEEAKQLVEDAYKRTQQRLNEKLQREKVNPTDLLVSFKQPVGRTKEAVKAADTMHVTWALLKQKLQPAIPGDFNITDVLSPGQMQTIYKASGCAKQEQSPLQCDFNSPFRTITGECNNRRIPTLGANNRPYARRLLQEYEDGISLPRGWTENKTYYGFPLPLVRAVSNQIVAFNDKRLTDDPFRSVMFMQYGQFIDHDLDFGPSTTATLTFIKGADCENTCAKAPPCFPIKIPPNDPVKDPKGCMAFTRAAPACNGGYAIRNQINALTAFLDASMVYASEVDWARQLRNASSNQGLLAVNLNYTDKGLAYLPFGNPPGFPELCNKTNTTAKIPCFFAGDNRVNEMPGLTALQTLFMRFHNRMASQLKMLNPHMDSDTIYNIARKINGAVIQKITYSEYLPALLGDAFPRFVGRSTGYNDSVDPRIASSFTNAFRFGHASVRPVVFRLDSRYQLQSETPLEKEFFASWRIIQQGGIDPLIRGLLGKPAKLVRPDQLVVDALRDKLFEQIRNGSGLDLPSLNMQRGRDHGLPGYNAWRQFCGLSQPQNENELAAVIQNRDVAKKFMSLYKTPNNIDLWVGGVAEPLVRNGRVGPTFACIIGDQFRRTRTGDRFYYENPGVFTPSQLQALNRVSLAHIICENTNIREVPRNVFRANSYPGDFVRCSTVPRLSLFAWKCTCDSADGSC
ncbi:eosinophil peroxidase-like [Podarcis raffonei]|uniref:eosinophil peroxidase-like n=1 Tax=Podarcis raffonei TaxID=65483 RepID=UPI00232920D1|nr:eosinophil peroxidase-like [Podarcis raffonei]